MTAVFLTVLYSCPLCGIKDRGVYVTARQDEDVVVWISQVCVPAVRQDHVSTSPGCCATSIAELKIPFTGTDKVGGVNKQ